MKCKAFAVFIAALTAQATWAACGDSPLRQIAQDLSGQTVVAIGTIAMVVSATVIALGAGLPERTKRLTRVVLAISIVVAALSFLQTEFNVDAGVV